MPDEWKAVILKTGVDSLLSLVIEEGEISVRDASRRLGKDPEILEAWADALGKEKLITTFYSSAGDLVLKTTKRNIDAKKSKIKSLKESVSKNMQKMQENIESRDKSINLAHEHINDFESILNKDLSKIKDFQEELKNFKDKQDEIEAVIRKIDKEEDILRKSEKDLKTKETKISEESAKIIKVISVKHDLIKGIKDELSKIDKTKEDLKIDLKVIIKLSKILNEEHPKDLEKDMRDIEMKGEELKKKNSLAEKKFGIFRKMLSKLYSS